VESTDATSTGMNPAAVNPTTVDSIAVDSSTRGARGGRTTSTSACGNREPNYRHNGNNPENLDCVFHKKHPFCEPALFSRNGKRAITKFTRCLSGVCPDRAKIKGDATRRPLSNGYEENEL